MSRIEQRRVEEAAAIEQRNDLKRKLAAVSLKPPQFAVAMMGTDPVTPVYLIDDQIKTVDPQKIVFLAWIDPETCVQRVEINRALPEPMRLQYLGWMRYWYG